MLDRLLDLLLISRAAGLVRPARRPSRRGWYAAQADPVVGPALRLMQHHPEHPWTVAGLADDRRGLPGGVRATLQRPRRQPPMAFLTEWRLSLAADLLLEPDATVAAVARQVGYSTPFALSTAFSRARGMSPREHRARHEARTMVTA